MNRVSEGAENGNIAGVTAHATDADRGTTITYSLTDSANGRFAINATSGVISVLDHTQLDYEAARSHTVTVLATSSDGSTNTANFTIAVTNVVDVNEKPLELDELHKKTKSEAIVPSDNIPVLIKPAPSQRLVSANIVPAEYLSTDVVTNRSGFVVVVNQYHLGADNLSGGALMMNAGIPDQKYQTHADVRYIIPVDAFSHTNPNAIVKLSVSSADGKGLPSWLKFDMHKGEFKGIPPESYKGELAIRVRATDNYGNQIETQFRIRVGDVYDRLGDVGKPSLTAQLKSHGSQKLMSEQIRISQLAHSQQFYKAQFERVS